MTKKCSAMATMVSFLVFSWSCVIHSWKKTSLYDVKQEKREELNISAVQVHSGEKTEFNKTPAARIQTNSVVGIKRIYENFVLEKTKIRQPDHFEKGKPAKIITTDGTLYRADRILNQDDSSVTFNGYVRISIPLADVDYLWIKQVNKLATILLSTATAYGILSMVFFFVFQGWNSGKTIF